MTDFLGIIQEALNPKWVVTGIDRMKLKEDAENQVITIRSGGIKYFLFELDKKGVEVFPFFSNHKNLKRRADYLLFAQGKNAVFVLVIELKSGGEKKAEYQIRSTLHFSKYLMERIQYVEQVNAKLEFRGIACVPGSKTESSAVANCKAEMATNGGSELYLKRFLI